MTSICISVISYGVVYWSITTYHDEDEEDKLFKESIRHPSDLVEVKVVNLDTESFALTNPMDSASSKSSLQKSSKKLSKKSSKRKDSVSPETHIDKTDSFSVTNPISPPR
jgi:hypothetical protein